MLTWYPCVRYNRLSDCEVIGFYVEYLTKRDIPFCINHNKGDATIGIHDQRIYLETRIKEGEETAIDYILDHCQKRKWKTNYFPECNAWGISLDEETVKTWMNCIGVKPEKGKFRITMAGGFHRVVETPELVCRTLDDMMDVETEERS